MLPLQPAAEYRSVEYGGVVWAALHGTTWLRSTPMPWISASMLSPGLQVELERVGLDRRDARDGPGGEDVPGRVALRRVVRDQVRDGDEHLGGVAALADLAVDPQLHGQRLGVRHLVLGHDPRADRAEGVDRLGEGEHAGLHLAALDVAGRDVVEDGVPGDVVPGLVGPEELAGLADDDRELVVEFFGQPLRVLCPAGGCRRGAVYPGAGERTAVGCDPAGGVRGPAC